jgi:anti-sigma regulatory factor (Ser/Thr protein kinase)
MVTPTARWSSSHYRDATVAADLFNLPLPDPPPAAATSAIRPGGLPELRRLVAAHGARAGLDADRVAELTLAVNELATNTVEHTDGGGTLSVWIEDGYLVCQLNDTGHLVNPLAGRIPPAPASLGGGRGLVLVNHLCELVRVHTRPGSTTIRIHVAL